MEPFWLNRKFAALTPLRAFSNLVSTQNLHKLQLESKPQPKQILFPNQMKIHVNIFVMFASPCHVSDSPMDDTVCNKTLWELKSYRQDKKAIGRKILCRLNAQLWQQLLQFSAPFPIHCFKATEEITSTLVYFQ